MRLIKSVRVRNFRSLREARLDDLNEYTPLIGPNGTGKSNLLRSLSLFFTGYLDETYAPIDLARDFPDDLRKQKREIAVCVTLDLSGGYDVRETRRQLGPAIGDDQIAIERVWSYLPGGGNLEIDEYHIGPSEDALRTIKDDEIAAVQTLIRSVHFRYIPNHVRPAELIRSELQPLRKTLLGRLKNTKKYRSAGTADALVALNDVARDLFATLSRDVAQGTRQLRGVGPSVPKDFAEMAFQVALTAVSGTGSVQDPELQGSGTQSFILLHVLALLDSADRGQGFGWRKSSVWAIEEPESFLHAGLRTRFAADLRRFAADPWRQVIVTTHQDDFVRMGQTAWLMDTTNGLSSIERLPVRDALVKSSRMRISSLVHPLMQYPDEPLVLVEGEFDRKYLARALVEAGIRPRWKLVSMKEIDPTFGGGDAAITYLSANAAVVASRPDVAPLFVLRDWEDTKEASITAALAAHPYSRGLRCPEAKANPELGRTFKGIERYLPTSFVELHVPTKWLVPDSAASKFPLGVKISLSKSDRAALKQALAGAFDTGRFPSGLYLIDLANWLNDEIERGLTAIPAGSFVW